MWFELFAGVPFNILINLQNFFFAIIDLIGQFQICGRSKGMDWEKKEAVVSFKCRFENKSLILESLGEPMLWQLQSADIPTRTFRVRFSQALTFFRFGEKRLKKIKFF